MLVSKHQEYEFNSYSYLIIVFTFLYILFDHNLFLEPGEPHFPFNRGKVQCLFTEIGFGP